MVTWVIPQQTLFSSYSALIYKLFQEVQTWRRGSEAIYLSHYRKTCNSDEWSLPTSLQPSGFKRASAICVVKRLFSWIDCIAQRATGRWKMCSYIEFLKPEMVLVPSYCRLNCDVRVRFLLLTAFQVSPPLRTRISIFVCIKSMNIWTCLHKGCRVQYVCFHLSTNCLLMSRQMYIQLTARTKGWVAENRSLGRTLSKSALFTSR